MLVSAWGETRSLLEWRGDPRIHPLLDRGALTTVRSRVHRFGWSGERALTEPPCAGVHRVRSSVPPVEGLRRTVTCGVDVALEAAADAVIFQEGYHPGMGVLSAWQWDQVRRKEMSWEPDAFDCRQYTGAVSKTYNRSQTHLNNTTGYHTSLDRDRWVVA